MRLSSDVESTRFALPWGESSMPPRVQFITALGWGGLLLIGGCRSGSDETQARPEGGGTRAESRAHPVYPSVAYDPGTEPLAPVDVIDGPFDFQAAGPLEFLEYLRSAAPGKGPETNAAAFGGGLTVWGTHRGWIVEEDLPKLIAQLDSREPCLAVAKAISSFRSFENSTVGREAAFLIEGFRAEQDRSGYAGYPPALNSNRAPGFDGDAIRAWWSHR